MTGARRILVVDDNADAAEALVMLLEGLGHEAHVAHTGAAALKLAAERRPEVILLDLSLPDMSGIDVARRARQDPALAATLILGLSGFDSEEHRRHCADAGMDDYIVKPIGMNMLVALLDRVR
jgi:CheY-like chemotaxis protein